MNNFGSAIINAVTFARGVFAGGLPDIATIQSPSESVSSQGTTVNTWTDIGTAACRLESADASGMSEQEQVVAEKLTAIAIYRIRFAFGTSIQMKNRIMVNGRVFRLVSITNGLGYTVGISALAVEFN